LKLGCEWGTTSVILTEHNNTILATDISKVCIKKTIEMYKGIQSETLDVYDIKKALGFKVNFNKMYIDVSGLSGYRSLLDVIPLTNTYTSVFNLEIIVIKSGALNYFANRCKAWNRQ